MAALRREELGREDLANAREAAPGRALVIGDLAPAQPVGLQQMAEGLLMASGALIGLGEGEEQQAPAVGREVAAPRQLLHGAHPGVVDGHPLQGDQGQIRLRLGRIEGDRGVEGLQRLLRAAELAQDDPAPVLGVGIARIAIEDPLQDRQRLLMAAQLAQGLAQGEFRRGVVGPAPQHIPVARRAPPRSAGPC